MGFDKNGDEVSIDAVVLLYHMDSDGVNLKIPSKESSILYGDRIKDLADKNIEYFMLLGCNPGAEPSSSSNRPNVANQFLAKEGINNVLASDGTVFYSKGFLGKGATTLHSKGDEEWKKQKRNDQKINDGFVVFNKDVNKDVSKVILSKKKYTITKLIQEAVKAMTPDV